MENRIIIKIASQALSILFIAAALGIGFNYLRNDSIPLFSASKSANISISIEQAKKLFYSGKAIFVDARGYSFYKKAHIKGAINIPPHSKINSFKLPKDKLIITYCDDSGCSLSKELAGKLYSSGYNAYYLRDGFKGWISQKLPVEKAR